MSKCLNKRTRNFYEVPSGKCLNFALKFTLFTDSLLFLVLSRKDRCNVLIRKK